MRSFWRPIGTMRSLRASWTMLRDTAALVASALMLLQPVPGSTAEAPKDDRSNALLAPWSGPHGGLPPLDEVRVEDFVPALEATMAMQRRDVAAIASNLQAPTFANTVEALERSRLLYWRVLAVYWLWQTSMNSPAMQVVERQMEPRIAAAADEINQNQRLFERIDAIYQSAELKRLTPEQQRLVWLYRTTMIKQGARLTPAEKARVAEINQRLAVLRTAFSQNVLADEQSPALVIDDSSDLTGLSAADVDGAAREAARRATPNRWVIVNTRTAVESFLTNSPRRALREKAWRAFSMRGDGDGPRDNPRIAAEILVLRAESAKLLGFNTYADWRLSDAMASKPKVTIDLMMRVWQPAVAQARTQIAAMQKLADTDPSFPSDADRTIQPWDVLYYREKLRLATYDFDFSALAPYLQFDKVRDAMFWAAGSLYGLSFRPVSGVPIFHPDVTVYEVLGPQAQHVGLLYIDPFARPGKNSGAWMGVYRLRQQMIGNVTPLVSLNLNYRKGKAGDPLFISWDDAETLFHEFGHALHGLCSTAIYPSLAGPISVSDFGEAPAMANEYWLATGPVLARLVDQHGRALPQPLLDKLERARQFNKPLDRTFFLESALLDMNMHLDASTSATDLRTFERQTLATLGAPPAALPRHRIAHFSHVFADEFYASNYYGYLWADVLARDIFGAFAETGNPFDATVANRYLRTMLSVGNTVDPGEAFRRFRGRDPSPDHLLRAEGLAR
jgi:peptidyl-dipeptidase Dcp